MSKGQGVYGVATIILKMPFDEMVSRIGHQMELNGARTGYRERLDIDTSKRDFNSLGVVLLNDDARDYIGTDTSNLPTLGTTADDDRVTLGDLIGDLS